MLFSEHAWIHRRHRVRPRKNSQSASLRKALLRGIGARAAPVAIGPGLTGRDHPLPKVVIVQFNLRQNTTVVIMPPAVHHNQLPQRPALERVAGSPASGLADFGRIDTVHADVNGRAAA